MTTSSPTEPGIPALRLGTRALGLSVDWIFRFVPAGTPCQATRNAVYLGVGNQLGPGVIDPHHDARAGASTSELVLRYPEYIYDHLAGPWLQRREEGVDLSERRARFVIITHEAPDFDAVTSAWLVNRLIEDGELPSFAPVLAGYSALIAQGHYHVDLAHPATGTHPPHMAFLAIQNIDSRRGERLRGHDLWTWHLERGAALLERTFSAILAQKGAVSSGDLLPGAGEAADSISASWRADPRFSDVVNLLDADLECFQEDLRERGVERSVTLPTDAEGGLTEVRALVLREPPTSSLNKYWTRAAGFVLLVCPYRGSGGDLPIPEGVFPRVVISLDPDWRDSGQRKPTLRWLGQALERAEAAARARLPQVPRRGATPRYDDGSCDNADPWYDGRGHSWTIVDSPASNTWVPYAEIRRVVAGRFWQLDDVSIEVTTIALSELEGRASGRSRGLPAGMSRTMEAWFRDSVMEPLSDEAQGGRSRIGLPPVFARAAEIEVTRGDGLTPDEVVESLPVSAGDSFVLLEAALSPHSEALLRAGLRQRCPSLRPVAGFDRTLIGDRLLVRLCPHRDLLDPGSAGLLRETILYALATGDALARLSQAVSRIVGVDRAGADVRLDPLRTKGIQRDLLLFQTRYWQVDVTDDAATRAVFFHVREQRRHDDHYREVGREVEGLSRLLEAQLAEEEQRSDRLLRSLLSFVGLTGLLQTLLAILVFETAKGPIQEGLAGLLVLIGGVWIPVSLWWRGRKKKAPS